MCSMVTVTINVWHMSKFLRKQILNIFIKKKIVYKLYCMHADRCESDFCSDHFTVYTNIESLFCILKLV